MLIKQGKTNWKLLLIVVVLTAIVGGVILFTQKERNYFTEWWSENVEEKSEIELPSPINVSLSLSNAPALNQEATLIFIATLLETNMEDLDSSIEVLLPEGFELVSGSLSREEEISSGESIQISVRIKSVKNGTWTIEGKGEIGKTIGLVGINDKLYITVFNDTASISKYLPSSESLPGGMEKITPEEVSDWVKELITREESGLVANPPALLKQCEYKNQIVYYLPSRCCDAFSILYDKSGNVICAPDGGITGKGDGRCPDFLEERKNCEVIWKDSRSYP